MSHASSQIDDDEVLFGEPDVPESQEYNPSLSSGLTQSMTTNFNNHKDVVVEALDRPQRKDRPPSRREKKRKRHNPDETNDDDDDDVVDNITTCLEKMVKSQAEGKKDEDSAFASLEAMLAEEEQKNEPRRWEKSDLDQIHSPSLDKKSIQTFHGNISKENVTSNDDSLLPSSNDINHNAMDHQAVLDGQMKHIRDEGKENLNYLVTDVPSEENNNQQKALSSFPFNEFSVLNPSDSNHRSTPAFGMISEDKHEEEKEEERRLLEQSRRAFDRWHQNQQKSSSRLPKEEPFSSQSQKLVSSSSWFASTFGKAPTTKKRKDRCKEALREKSKNEFIQSNRGMMIPKHWKGDGAERESHVAAMAKRKTSQTAKQVKSLKIRSGGKTLTADQNQQRSTSNPSTTLAAAAAAAAQSKRPHKPMVPLLSLRPSKINSNKFKTDAFDGKSPDKKTISFAPSFAVPLPPPEDPLVNNDDDSFLPASTVGDNHERRHNTINTDSASGAVGEGHVFVLTTHTSSGWWNPSPPRSRRHSSFSRTSAPGAGNGKWSMRYKKVRDTIRADGLRLRNSTAGQAGDPMDPRNTACSYTDVTVLSEHPTAWFRALPVAMAAGQQQQKSPSTSGGWTILVFLHHHHRLRSLRKGNDKEESASTNGGLAWCFLPRSNHYQENLFQGSNLRLYNAVVTNHTGGMLHIVGSQLVEPYPGSRVDPALPTLDELADQENLEI